MAAARRRRGVRARRCAAAPPRPAAQLASRQRLRGFDRHADQRPHERGQVGRAARGDQVAVHHDLRVLPLGPRVAQVVGDRRHRGHAAALDDPGRDRHPAGVADEGDRLVLLVQAANQRLDALVGAQLVGAEAAGDHQQVQVVGHQVGGRLIGDQLDPLLATHGLPAVDPDPAHGRPRLLKAVVRDRSPRRPRTGGRSSPRPAGRRAARGRGASSSEILRRMPA